MSEQALMEEEAEFDAEIASSIHRHHQQIVRVASPASSAVPRLRLTTPAATSSEREGRTSPPGLSKRVALAGARVCALVG